MKDQSYQADALSRLAAQLNTEQMPEALRAARGMEDESSRTRALSWLAAQLPENEQFEILPLFFSIASRSISVSSYQRCHLLEPIVMAWEKLEFKQFEHANWNEGLPGLARDARKHLLDDLTALLPLINHLGGQAAVGEMFYALRDVGRWWP